MKVGFIGVGSMGNPMAQNLLKAGHALTVHDLRREAAQNLEAMGAAWAESAREAAAGAEVVITSLPMPKDVEDTVLGSSGVLAGMRPGGAVIDMSTNAPSVVQRLAQVAKGRGIDFVDAPVSGRVRGARNATLAIMVGGDKDVYEQVAPLLRALGSNVFHVGPAGTGNVAKLINNMMAFVNMVAAIEGLVLGAKAGIDPHTLWQVVKASTGQSFIWEAGARAILRDRLVPTFTTELACKDIGLAAEMAEQLGVPVRMGLLAQELLRAHRDRGFGGEDMLTLVKDVEERAGVEVRGSWREPTDGPSR